MIGPREERGRDREAEGPGGPRGDDQLHPRRLLDGQVGRPRAPEDLVHVGGRPAVQLRLAGAAGHEPAGLRVLARARGRGAGELLCVSDLPCGSDDRARRPTPIARLLRRGAAGLVTDGALRDSPAIAETDFPVYAAGASPPLNLAQHHAVEIGAPIGCGGVPVFPGDVVVGDEEAVVVLPRHLAAEIARGAAAQERLETFVLDKVDGGAALAGTYPPSPETVAEYRAWLARRARGQAAGGLDGARVIAPDAAHPAGQGAR